MATAAVFGVIEMGEEGLWNIIPSVFRIGG